MTTIMKIFQSVLWAVPFVVLCLSTRKANLNKVERGKQFLMPIIALVYSVVAMIFLEQIISMIEKLIKMLGRFVPVIKMININQYMVYIANLAILAVFLAVKGFVLPIIKGIWNSSKSLMEATSGICYEYEEDIDKWLVKKEYGQVKTYYTGIYYAALTVSTLILIFAKVFPRLPFFRTTFYPAIGLIVVGEVINFLSGLTKSEFVEDILGEDEDSYKVANYGLLREVLRGIFGKRVLYDATMDSGLEMSTNFETLEEMLDSESQTIINLGQYFKTLKESGEDIDANYVKSCVNLVRGQSTLFCNPFYKDLTNYVMYPMIRHLMKYRKCLVVMGRDSSTDDVKEWLEQGVYNLVHTDSLWKVDVLG